MIKIRKAQTNAQSTHQWHMENKKHINLGDKLNEFSWKIDILDNQHTSAKYKRDLVRKIGLKTIAKAIERAE